MLKKRIIPCLDIKRGRVVKGVNFIGLQDAGDPVLLAKEYVSQGADELVFLDITATVENRKAMYSLVERIASEINIPFTVGGGIKSVQDARAIIMSGADKVSINSASVRSPLLISQIAEAFGSQCVVVAIDTCIINHQWEVVIEGGRTQTGIRTIDWVEVVQKKGAGEILLTSMDHDGAKSGFSIELINELRPYLGVPLIASGGAGCQAHFLELFKETQCSAALAASVFHFGEIEIPTLKAYLKENKLPIR